MFYSILLQRQSWCSTAVKQQKRYPECHSNMHDNLLQRQTLLQKRNIIFANIKTVIHSDASLHPVTEKSNHLNSRHMKVKNRCHESLMEQYFSNYLSFKFMHYVPSINGCEYTVHSDTKSNFFFQIKNIPH